MRYIAIVFVTLLIGLGIVLFANNRETTIKATASPTQAASSPTSETAQMTVFSQNLEIPWAIAFLPASQRGEPDKRMLVTERPGRVRIVNSDGSVVEKPAATLPVIKQRDSEGGLLGIALHPNFAQNHFVYLYYTYSSNGNTTLNRVVRMKFENDTLSDEQIIVNTIPGALYHNGGRIKFGPDNFLYITTGDSQEPSLAQNKNSLAGKILRVTDEGKAAPGNSFGNLAYSYGHRNPQGIAWDSTEKLWSTEHGRSNPTGYDEINLIESGKNYGWPTIEGDKTQEGMVTPKRNSGATTTWAPAGSAFVGNSFFFSGLRGEALYEAKISGDQITSFKEHFKGEFGRIREVILGPDGMLYLTTSNRDGRGTAQAHDDKIIRINPSKL